MPEWIADFLRRAIYGHELLVGKHPFSVRGFIRPLETIERRRRNHLPLTRPLKQSFQRAVYMQLLRRKFFQTVRDREDIFRRDAIEWRISVLAEKMLGEQ